MRSAVVPSLLVVLAACASSTVRDGYENPSAQTNDPDAAAAPGNNPGPGGTFDTDGGLPEEQEVVCDEEQKNKLYVVSTDNVLYSFEPAILKFTRIGIINCSTVSIDATGTEGQAHSMAVDRHGNAWLNLTNGDTYKVDTKTAACSSTGTTFKNTSFSLITMGFSTVSETVKSENLFVIGNGHEWTFFLGKIDPKTLQPSTIGTLVGDMWGSSTTATTGGELTGTGDGRLYGFFKNDAGGPMALGQIKKENAEVTKIADIAGTVKGAKSTAYAFSFWGGDFWFYFSADDAPSKVIRYKAATDKTQEVVVNDVGGFRISGAGVSTCAPVVPPVVK